MRWVAYVSLAGYACVLAWAFRIMARPNAQEVEDAMAYKLLVIRRESMGGRDN